MTTCAATNCGKTIPATIIFCGPHWWALPADLKRKLLKPKTPEAYKIALEQAIGVIRYKEGA